MDRLGAGYTYFLTLNAPGVNAHRRWFQGKRPASRPDCHCHESGMTLGEWNANAAKCWNRLRLALSRLTDGSLTYIGSVEVQKRGALHRHIVLNVDRVLLPSEVQALALEAGFGCVFDLQVLTTAEKVAYYVSKYVTKSSGERHQVPWVADVVDQVTGEVRAMSTVATFRTWSAAQSWGFTKKGLREIARAQARAREMYLREFAQLLAGDQAPRPAVELAGTAPPG